MFIKKYSDNDLNAKSNKIEFPNYESIWEYLNNSVIQEDKKVSPVYKEYKRLCYEILSITKSVGIPENKLKRLPDQYYDIWRNYVKTGIELYIILKQYIEIKSAQEKPADKTYINFYTELYIDVLEPYVWYRDLLHDLKMIKQLLKEYDPTDTAYNKARIYTSLFTSQQAIFTDTCKNIHGSVFDAETNFLKEDILKELLS